jgi:hypothetical protein
MPDFRTYEIATSVWAGAVEASINVRIYVCILSYAGIELCSKPEPFALT